MSRTSDRCSSAMIPAAQKARNKTTSPSHTNMLAVGDAPAKANLPTAMPTRPPTAAKQRRQITRIRVIRALIWPWRRHWLRVNRQRNHSIPRSCVQFMSLLQPTELLSLGLTPAHCGKEPLLQRARAVDFAHG